MNIFQVIVLSVVEGITEFLPVSSTGHLILASKLLGLAQGNFIKSFEIAIQSGAIAAAVFLYFQTFTNFKNLKKLFAAFIPTALVGFILYKPIKESLIGNINVTIAALFLGGIFIILFEKYFAKRGKLDIAALSLKKAFVIGVIQSISVIPGVSRAAATIIGGESVGLTRSSSVEFSFILAVPTLFAATGYDLLKNYKTFSGSDWGMLIVGFLVSFVVAVAVMKWFIGFVRKFDLTSFGIYRIIIAIVFLLLP